MTELKCTSKEACKFIASCIFNVKAVVESTPLLYKLALRSVSEDEEFPVDSVTDTLTYFVDKLFPLFFILL